MFVVLDFFYSTWSGRVNVKKHHFKYTIAIILTAGSVVLAHAGTVGPVCVKENVTIPCPSQSWGVGVQALYLKPNYSQIFTLGTSGTVNTVTTPGTSSTTVVPDEPNRTWGFALEGFYRFHAGRDINLNWYHLNQKTTTTRFQDFNINVSAGEPTVFVNTTTHVSNTTPSWDAVNLEFSQQVDYGENQIIRFHGGLQYSRIKREISDIDSTVSTPLEPNVIFSNLTVTSNAAHSYRGFGPRIGADMTWQVIKRFNLFANSAATLLAGTSKFSTSSINKLIDPDTGEIDSIINQSSNRSSRATVVPELEGKVGVGYHHPNRYGSFDAQAGYIWVNYFSPLVDSTSDSNFGLQGPFVHLKWTSNV